MKKILFSLLLLVMALSAFCDNITDKDRIIIDNYNKIKDFSYIKSNKLSATDKFVKVGNKSLLWEFDIDKYRNSVVGIVKDNINRDVPEKIEFYVYPNNKLLLYVGIEDSDGNRLVQFPVYGVDAKQWNKVSLDVNKLSTFARGADRIKNVKNIFIGTQDGAGEYGKSGRYSAYISEITFIYPYGKGAPQSYDIKDIDAMITSVKIKRDNIASRIDLLNSQGLSCKYEIVSKQVIDRFLINAKNEATEGKINRAYDQLAYLGELADKTIKELDLIKQDPTKYVDYKEPNMSNLKVKDGVFYDNDRPVFVFGLCGWYGANELKEIKDTGFNYTSMENGPNSDNNPAVLADIKAKIEAMKANNLATTMLLSPHYIDTATYDANPSIDPNSARRNRNPFMPWDVTSKDLKTVVANHLAYLIPEIKDYPNLLGYDLINELWYEMLPDFDYKDFKDANINYENPWVAQGEYTKHNVYNFLNWYNKELEKYDNTKPTWVKVIGNMEVIGGNREDVSDNLKAHGVDIYTDPVDPTNEFACDVWNQSIILDSYRSFDNNKIIADGEYHINPYSGAKTSGEYVGFCMWNTFVRGKDISGIWVWGREIENDMNPFYCQPWAVEAAGKTTMDVNRVAEYVVPFAKANGEYAVFYGGEKFEELYKACNFSDVNFDLITNKMITSGKLKPYKFIVVMNDADISKESLNALKGTSIVKIKSGNDKNIYNTINKNLNKKKIYPLVDIDKWGVEVRSYEKGGKLYCYLMNYNKNDVKINLPKTSKNLLTGESINTVTLKPMDFYLLEM